VPTNPDASAGGPDAHSSSPSADSVDADRAVDPDQLNGVLSSVKDAEDGSASADWSVPRWIRHPRLEGTFGVRLAEITWQHIESIVNRQSAEDLSVDFKRSHYVLNRAFGRSVLPSSPQEDVDERILKDRFELAKDVSAFANAAGGLIVVGIAEANGRAQQILPVELKDVQRLAYLDVIRSWTAPYLSDVEIGHLASPSDPAQGCVLIFVPPSASGPHAVVEPNSHRHTWYVRDGGHATPLSEAQVAVAYRDRFAGRSDLEQRVRDIFDQGVSELDREGRVWLAVAVAPARGATHRLLDRRLLDEFKTQTEERQRRLPGALLGHHAFFGRGRVVLQDTSPGMRAGDHLLHLYADGGAFVAVVLDTLSDAAAIGTICQRRPELRPTLQCIRVGSLTTWVLTLTGTASGHAVDAGGSGDLELVCGIITATEAQTDLFSPDAGLTALQHVMLDQPWRHSPVEDMIPSTTWRDVLTPVRTTLSAAAASDGRELVAVGAQLVSELVAEFGYVPSDPLLSADGFVVGANCHGSRLEGLRGWAESRGLLEGEPHQA
jgi:hypothetical protein